MKEANWLHFGMTLPALINRVRAPPPTLCTMGEYETQHPTHGRRQAELAAPTPRAPDGKPDLSENDIQHSVGR
jgi:hypothetical protein